MRIRGESESTAHPSEYHCDSSSSFWCTGAVDVGEGAAVALEELIAEVVTEASTVEVYTGITVVAPSMTVVKLAMSDPLVIGEGSNSVVLPGTGVEVSFPGREVEGSTTVQDGKPVMLYV